MGHLLLPQLKSWYFMEKAKLHMGNNVFFSLYFHNSFIPIILKWFLSLIDRLSANSNTLEQPPDMDATTDNVLTMKTVKSYTLGHSDWVFVQWLLNWHENFGWFFFRMQFNVVR